MIVIRRIVNIGRHSMNVSLTPELEKFVSAKVETGRYNSASEVVREALRLLEERDQERVTQLVGFNRELGRRLEALDRGEFIDPAEARAKLKRKSEQRRQSKA
ncbi:MAG TPA: type II toxin-antitoxin system ParD family antitoxin [Bryobacteraceae bacterium]|nr:type II toxin-antitoxin system ParD family antitoxin [Bryobacteraceae bacterium]